MANNCMTTYVLVCEDEKKLDRIYEAVKMCNQPEYKLAGNDGTPYWTGNIFRELGLKYESDRSFWYDVSFDDGVLRIYEDAAWTRGSAMSQLVEQMEDPEDADNDLVVYFYTEEPGCEIYESNDDCHLYFTDEYVVDACNGEDYHQEYFDSFNCLLEDVNEFLGEELKFKTFDELETYLEAYNQNHRDDDAWVYIHEIDYSATL